MRRALLIAGVLAVAAGAALAQSAAIGERKAQLKAYGAAAGPIGKMLRGEDAFVLATVQASLDTFSKNAKTLTALFPDDSKSGGETKALPAIWENKAKFNGLFAKLDTDAVAAKAAIKDEASFKAEIPKVLGNCGACHNEFRAK